MAASTVDQYLGNPNLKKVTQKQDLLKDKSKKSSPV